MKAPRFFSRFLFEENIALTLISAFFLLCILNSSAVAADFYVATDGNDSNAGTQTAPFRTIAKGLAAASAGDSVIVKDGTYGPEGNYTCGTVCSQQTDYTTPVSILKSGTASAPITIKAEHKWGAVLDCGLPDGYAGDGTDGVQACDSNFILDGDASYITIQDFDITRAYWDGIHINGTGNHDIVIKGNHIHHIGNRHYIVPSGADVFGIDGVFAGTRTSNITFDGNVFNNIGRLPTSGQSTTDYNHDHGIYIYNGPYSITNNIFYNNKAGWGIQISPGTHDTYIYNNTFFGANPNRDGQITLWADSSHPHTNIKIANNIFYNPRNFAITSYQDTENDSLITNNIVCCSGVDVVNTGSIGGSLTVTDNKTNTDPSFVNVTAYDFHLNSSSLAKGVGIATSPEVPTDLDGNLRSLPLDLGAYEVKDTTQPVTPSPSTTLADTTPPTVLITVPASDTQVSGTITISATASDDIRVAGVQFKVDDKPVGVELTAEPYNFSLDTKTLTNATHVVTAVARDTSNNISVSAPVNIRVQNVTPIVILDNVPPTISNVQVSNITPYSAIISWITNELSNSAAAYGTIATDKSVVNGLLVTVHSVSLTNLKPKTVYSFQVSSRDASQNTTTSAVMTFQTRRSYYRYR